MRPTLKLTVFATLTAFALTSAGCSDGTGGRMTMDPGGGAPDQPNTGNPHPDAPNPDGPGTPPPPPAHVANYSGVYDVTAPIDFTQNGVLPGAIGPALGALAELHDHPGDAIIKVVEAANIPYLSDILNKVPSFLTKALAGLLDDLIIKNLYNGYPVVDQVANIIQGIFELTQKIEIHDALTVHKPDSKGVAALEQQLTGVGFTLLNNKTVVSFANAKKVAMSGTVTPLANAPVADADLTVGAGSFMLPIGDLLLQAAGPLLFGQIGGAKDLKGALDNLVPCDAFGQDISDGLGGFITKDEASMFCTGAIGLIADQVTNQIKAITFDGVMVDNGKAKLYDLTQQKPNVDYQSDRVAEGTWTWSFTVAGGTAAVPSTFAGDRVADAN
jgi:hypothetical protein